MTGYTASPRTLNSQLLWRCRKNDKDILFRQVSDVWCPPATLATLGRLNRENEPILYASAHESLAALEVHPQPGDLLTIIELRRKPDTSKPVVMELGVAEKNAKFNVGPRIELFTETVRGQELLASGESIAKQRDIRSFLAEEFTRPVAKGNEHLFKISAAIAEIFLTGDACDGVLYPACAGNPAEYVGGQNVGLKPDRANSFFEVSDCKVVRASTVNGKLQFNTIQASRQIESSGRINW